MTSNNDPADLLASSVLAEALETYADPDAWGTWNSVKCDYEEDGKEWLYSDQGAVLARKALAQAETIRKHGDAVRRVVKEAIKAVEVALALDLCGCEQAVDCTTDLYLAIDALPPELIEALKGGE